MPEMYRRLITFILCFAACLCVPCLSHVASAQTFNKYEESYNFKRAVEAIRDKNDSEAIEYLNKEISVHKDNGYAYVLQQYLYHKNNQYGSALTAAGNALSGSASMHFVISTQAESSLSIYQ